MGKYISYGKDDYKKTLADFMAMVNPKPDQKIIEQLQKKYEDSRKKGAGANEQAEIRA